MKAYRVVLRIMMLMANAINIISCNKFSAGSYSKNTVTDAHVSISHCIFLTADRIGIEILIY